MIYIIVTYDYLYILKKLKYVKRIQRKNNPKHSLIMAKQNP